MNAVFPENYFFTRELTATEQTNVIQLAHKVEEAKTRVLLALGRFVEAAVCLGDSLAKGQHPPKTRLFPLCETAKEHYSEAVEALESATGELTSAGGDFTSEVVQMFNENLKEHLQRLVANKALEALKETSSYQNFKRLTTLKE